MDEITRSHIAEKVMSAFRSGPADRQMILDEAKSQGAESDVIRTLERLSDRRYKSVRDLWEHRRSFRLVYELAHPETYLRPVRPLAEIHTLGAVGDDQASSAQRLADLTSIASSAGIEVIELDIDQPSTHGIIDLIVVLDRRSETAAGRLAAKEGIPLLRLPGGHIPCGLPLKGAFVREFPVLNVRGIGTVPQIAVASARVEARGHDAELIPKLEGIQLMPPVSFLCAQGPAPFGGPAQREVRAVGVESMLVTAPHESGATLVVSASTLLTVVIPDGRSAVMRTGPLGYWRAGQSSVLAWAPSGSGSSRVAPIIGRFDEASNRSPPDVAPVVGV